MADDGVRSSPRRFGSYGIVAHLRGACVRLRIVKQSNDFFKAPNVVRNASRHRRRDAQRLMNPREVIVQEIERARRDVLL